MSGEHRTVGDLDDDTTLYINYADRYSDGAPQNQRVLHLDSDCFQIRGESKPVDPCTLHADQRVCKDCDPEYEVTDRHPQGTSLAHQLQSAGIAAEGDEQ
jgi:hypothetical protein